MRNGGFTGVFAPIDFRKKAEGCFLAKKNPVGLHFSMYSCGVLLYNDIDMLFCLCFI